MSCRTGRLPMLTDPLAAHFLFSEGTWALNIAHLGKLTLFSVSIYKLKNSHRYVQYKGPDNPFARIRHKRFPAGSLWFGWGNNGLNRDCNFLEWACWSGYYGKEYTY